eukprot:COSAG06_NODE_5746_length_3294_cov_21.607512_2_plen_287_part_00
MQCLDYFLRNPQGVRLKPDVIMFNWGLHDTHNGTATPGQSGSPQVYAAELANITMQLKAKEPQAKLLFALTSPMLCNEDTDATVVELNKQAAAIMAKHSIPTVNLHDAITGKCGGVPQAACFNMTGCFCPHCGGRPAGQGYDWLAASTIVPALTKLLPTNRLEHEQHERPHALKTTDDDSRRVGNLDADPPAGMPLALGKCNPGAVNQLFGLVTVPPYTRSAGISTMGGYCLDLAEYRTTAKRDRCVRPTASSFSFTCCSIHRTRPVDQLSSLLLCPGTCWPSGSS